MVTATLPILPKKKAGYGDKINRCCASIELPFQAATWHILFYFHKYLPIKELFHVCQEAFDIKKMHNINIQ